MENQIEIIQSYSQKINNFRKDAHEILSIHESAKKSRVVMLHASFEKLKMLSIKEETLFKESLNCVENGFYRSAIVLSWVGFMHFVLEKIDVYGMQNVKLKKPSWNYSSIEELTEKQSEYAIIELLMEIGYCSKTEKKALHGLLNKRNECAHPSSHIPDINESLGYISELFKRIEQLQNNSK
jgi:hypothetical protein